MNKRILASLLVIGVVGAVAGGSTFALFNDTETSDTNTFSAGQLDLKVDWNETYNGEHVERQELTDNPGSIFGINDVKPGDEGEATVSLHVFNNPAWVDMNVTQTGDRENGCTEPEKEVDNTCGDAGEGEGELGDHLRLQIWRDDGDNVYEEGEEVYFNDTASELDGTETFWIDGDTSTEEVDAFENSTTEHVGIKWSVPKSVGNEIQTDSKHFRFDFWAVQRRHNPMGKDGDNGEPGEEEENVTPVNYQADLVGGEVIENLSEESYSDGNRLERFAHGMVFEDDAVVNTTGYPNQVFCIKESEEIEALGGGNDAETRVNFTIKDKKGCKDETVTFASYKNTGDLGWSGGQNMILEDFKTEEVDRGQSYSWTIDLPDPEIQTNP